MQRLDVDAEDEDVVGVPDPKARGVVPGVHDHTLPAAALNLSNPG